MVNVLQIVNHIGANKGSQEKHLKFPINVDRRGPYKHHLVVRVDTGYDVNCINEKTFKRLFPKVKLPVCPHEIQNFENSVADISIQFCTYLQFRGEKYLNTYCHQCQRLAQSTQPWSNLPRRKCCEGRKCTNFKINMGTSSNVFQILQDL